MSMPPFRVDRTVTDWVVPLRGEPWTTLWQIITVLGDPLTLTLVVIAAFLLSWLGNRIDLALLVVAGPVTGWMLSASLKLLFARPRPPVGDHLVVASGQSFPSGHSFSSVVVYGLVAFAAYRLYPWVRAHKAVLAAAPVLAVLIGVSRIYLGVHWLSDVLFGWTFGVIWLAVCLAVHVWVGRRIRLATRLDQSATG